MVLVVSVLLAEIVLFILIALHYEQGQVLFKQRLVSQIKTYNHQHPGQYEKAVDFVQNQVESRAKPIHLVFTLAAPSKDNDRAKCPLALCLVSIEDDDDCGAHDFRPLSVSLHRSSYRFVRAVLVSMLWY